MTYTLSILEEHFDVLRHAAFSLPGCEGAAYLLCGVSDTGNETRLLVRHVVPVRDEHYLVREPERLSVASESYVSVAKRALREKAAVVFVHSHPGGYPDFSPQDDREEPKLMRFIAARTGRPCATMILIADSAVKGRVWLDGQWADISRVRVMGTRFRYFDQFLPGEAPIPEFFDRQVRAFGPDIQRLLGRLHVGVVGAGGTGSAIAEELTRLGVGRLSVFDGDSFSATNVNRVYGSSSEDAGINKAEIAARNGRAVKVGTNFAPTPAHITSEEVAKSLRECDIVFGCTDKHAPRGILVELSLQYLIPVFDLGVKVKADGQTIRSVIGRVTTLVPGEACLFCRERISSEIIQLESLSPEEQRALADENYAPELGVADPAVIPFTTGVASQAVTELIQRLTGFMGDERKSSEVLLFFHTSEIHRNRQAPKEDCLCKDVGRWGRGDRRDFLGLAWADD